MKFTRLEVVEENADAIDEYTVFEFDPLSLRSPNTFLSFIFSSYCFISFANPNSILSVVGDM